ncbi:unnamed protein product, partial [Chrysoparadoxa australica]
NLALSSPIQFTVELHPQSVQTNVYQEFFTSIVVSGGVRLEVEYEQGEQTVEVVGPNAHQVQMKVKNGVLKISPARLRASLEETVVKIKVEYLNELTMSGESDVELMGHASQTDLKVNISGASKLHVSADFNHLKMNCSGASTVKLDGTALESKMQISGASKVKGSTFLIEKLKLQSSGASHSTLAIGEELTVAVSGASEVTYVGTPNIIRQSVTGAGRLPNYE